MRKTLRMTTPTTASYVSWHGLGFYDHYTITRYIQVNNEVTIGIEQRWADCEIFQSESSPDPQNFWKSSVRSSPDRPM